VKKEEIVLEASRPNRGVLLSVDGEGEATVKFQVDASQTEKLKKLMDLPFGETFNLKISFGNG
jgi:hypothetical protein